MTVSKTTQPSIGTNGPDFLVGTDDADQLRGLGGNDTLTGGRADDRLEGGSGSDTAVYSDLDVPVSVNLAAGNATRDTGFSLTTDTQPLASLAAPLSDAELVAEAAAGNLYFNIHTSDFPGGEIRGQLLVASDVTSDGIRTLTLSATLDAAQEPQDASDSTATGSGQVVISIDGDTITYSSDLSVTGLAVSDLLPVAGISSIHIHNAPAGQNGPVVADLVQDAGGDVTGASAAAADGTVFDEQSETDTLVGIESIDGSDDSDILFGSRAANTLNGNGGDDDIRGRRGADELNGGEGNDALRGGNGRDTCREHSELSGVGNMPIVRFS